MNSNDVSTNKERGKSIQDLTLETIKLPNMDPVSNIMILPCFWSFLKD